MRYTAIILLFIALPIQAIEIAFAPLVIEGELTDRVLTPRGKAEARQLKRMLNDLDTTDAIKTSFHDNPPSLEDTITILDAGAFSTYHGIEILVYGRIFFTPQYIDAVVRVYEAETNEIQKTLYSRDSADHQERLLQDLANKLYDYLTRELGLAPIRIAREKERALLDFRGGLSYWTPAGQWRQSLSGIHALELGAYLTPIYPLRERGAWLNGIRLGVSMNYRIGINTPGSERFVYHGLRFGIPIEFTHDYREEHRITLYFQPLMQLDIISQERHYSDRWVGSTATGGVGIGSSYTFKLTPSSSIGALLEWATVYYEPILSEFRLGVFYEYHLGSINPG